MSKLTSAIGKAIGKRLYDNGGGRMCPFFYVCDENGQVKRGGKNHKKTIDDLKNHFECWKLIRDTRIPDYHNKIKVSRSYDWIFHVRDKKGNFLGGCQIDPTNDDCNVIVNIIDEPDFDKFQKAQMDYKGYYKTDVVLYERHSIVK